MRLSWPDGQPPSRRDEPVPPPARGQPRRLVPVGRRGVRSARAPRTSRSCSPSATPPATGATSWSTSRSRTTETAALMNERFVNIKVDREERPDVDALYMDAVVALTGHGGWPMTVFLTPEGEPFFGGTYFPPEPRHGLPSFRQVLDRGLERVPRAARRHHAPGGDRGRGRAPLGRAAPSSDPLTESMLGEATRALARAVRPRVGRLGRRAQVPAGLDARVPAAHAPRGDDEALAMVTQTLDAMAAGGMYDLVGGGFHRYSVDGSWLVPHFEKMLYDNALLAPRISTPGRSPARSATGAWPRRRSTTCSASCGSPRAASPRRRTRTRTASRA